jgi:hypothetical protein
MRPSRSRTRPRRARSVDQRFRRRVRRLVRTEVVSVDLVVDDTADEGERVAVLGAARVELELEVMRTGSESLGSEELHVHLAVAGDPAEGSRDEAVVQRPEKGEGLTDHERARVRIHLHDHSGDGGHLAVLALLREQVEGQYHLAPAFAAPGAAVAHRRVGVDRDVRDTGDRHVARAVRDRRDHVADVGRLVAGATGAESDQDHQDAAEAATDVRHHGLHCRGTLPSRWFLGLRPLRISVATPQLPV